MREHASQASVDRVIEYVKNNGFDIHLSEGKLHTIIGAVGEKTIDPRNMICSISRGNTIFFVFYKYSYVNLH